MWDSTCNTVKLYTIFMVALIFYDVYNLNSKAAIKNVFHGVVGAVLLFVLCAANLEFVGWALLALPVIFYIFLLVVIVFDQGFNITHEYKVKTAPAKCDAPEVEAPPVCEATCEEETSEEQTNCTT
jgi:hypothetical protein